MPLLAAALLSGCGANESAPTEKEPVQIQFHVLEVEHSPMSRAALKESCNSLAYYRYTDGELTKTDTQESSDADFGVFSDYLTWGEHELCFVGHKSSSISEQGGVVSFDKVTDTFTHYLRLIVDGNVNRQQQFTLKRRVAKFELLALDAIPENVDNVRIEVAGVSDAVNLRTGEAGAAMNLTKTISVPGSLIGESGNTFSAYVFLPEGVEEVDITVTTIDANGEDQVEFFFEDVEMQVNYITRYKGNLFGTNAGFTITVDDEWEDTNEIEF